MEILLTDNAVLLPEGEGIEQKISRFQQWLNGAGEWFMGMLPNFLTALIILIGGWWLIKLVLRVMTKALDKGKVDKTVITFLNSLIKTVLWIILGICILSALGFDVSTLITALGAAAVTVGLALKDSLSNVASGTLIIINQKFKTGDFIETEGIIGEVIKIEMMYTTLRTYDYKEVMIPNSRLTANNVINHFTMGARRLEIPVPISYEEDYEKARAVIMDVLHSDERIMQDRGNKVVVDKFGESSVDLIVWLWCSPEDYWPVLFDTRVSIKKALDKAGITIPFNQLDVHFDGDINDKLDHLRTSKEKIKT